MHKSVFPTQTAAMSATARLTDVLTGKKCDFAAQCCFGLHQKTTSRAGAKIRKANIPVLTIFQSQPDNNAISMTILNLFEFETW